MGKLIEILEFTVKREQDAIKKLESDDKALKHTCYKYGFDITKIRLHKYDDGTAYLLDSGMEFDYIIGHSLEQAIRWMEARWIERM